MDIFAHGLWTNVMFRTMPQTKSDKKSIWWGIFFGVVPDLISFTPVFAVFVFDLIFGHRTFRTWPPISGSAVFDYAANSYNYTHSFVLWAVVLGLVWIISRKFPWSILGAFLHIGIDLFTHPDFYRTPFLFPLSSYHNPYAISWAHPVFMAINYSAIIIIYVFLIPRLKKLMQKDPAI